MYSNNFELLVCISGRPVREYGHEGRVFIEARKGSNYTLKLRNNGGIRGMAIFSVDGVDVLKGKAAGQSHSGYIIEPYSSIEIKGYRISDHEVASFVFTDGKLSYAAEVGNAANNGVIGVRVIGEKVINTVVTSIPFIGNVTLLPPITGACPQNPWHPVPNNPDVIWYKSSDSSCLRSMTGGGADAQAYSCSLSDNNPPSSDLQARSFDLGTAWGNKLEDTVTKVDFEPDAILCEMEMYYASRQALTTIGIDFSLSTKVASAFPKAFGDKYCKIPSGYKM